MDREQHTVAGLMELVSEFGQCRWSEGTYGASFIAKAQERNQAEQAADLYRQIESYAAHLRTLPAPAAGVPEGWKLVPVEPTQALGKWPAQTPAAAAQALHTDHPMRHYDRTCPACNPDDVTGTSNDQGENRG